MNTKKIAIVICAVFMAAALSTYAADEQSITGQTGASAKKVVVIIPLTGEVDYSMAISFAYALKKAEQLKPDIYIFEITTPGGTLQESMEIANKIIELKPEKISFIKQFAYSGGAFIAVAADKIIMQPNSVIGDCQPILATAEGEIKEGPEKIQSPIRTHFRGAAQRNGWPVTLSEAMVTKGPAIYEIELQNGSRVYAEENQMDQTIAPHEIKSKTLVLKENYLLTMTATEALRYGFASGFADSPEDYLEKRAKAEGRSTSDAFVIHRIEKTGWEMFCEFLISPTMKLVFLIIGVLGIYIELKVPGFGAPGIVGVLALGLLLFAHYLYGMAEIWEISLIVLGFGLIAVEIFLTPGIIVAAAAGIACVLVGLILSFQTFSIPEGPSQTVEFEINLATILGAFIIFFVIAVILAVFLPRSGLFKRLALVTYPGGRTISDAENQWKIRSDLVGKTGVAKTLLRPAGKAEIGGEYLDVVAEGEYIPEGSSIRVKTVEGNRVIVTRDLEVSG
jgi:membrane-bound serine protease (ClpP class)